MRLFIAVNLNDEIKNYLMEAISELRKASSGGRFTHRDNLHLTLAFLGEQSPDRLDHIETAMNHTAGEPFRLTFSGFGKFRRRGGDIHWAGIENNPVLNAMQKRLVGELESFGFKIEDREYSPHLTLGREVRLIDQHADIYKAQDDGIKEMTVTRISLMKSERIDGKLTYTEVFGRDLSK